MQSAEAGIPIGTREVPLDGIACIELLSGDRAEVQLSDGTVEYLEGADVASLTRWIAGSRVAGRD
jgi:hypothetical protein